MTYGLTIENQNLINSKAKDKKDGIYTFRGVVYRVKSHKVMAFAVDGKILEQYGNFNAIIGSYEGGEIAAKKCISKLSE